MKVAQARFVQLSGEIGKGLPGIGVRHRMRGHVRRDAVADTVAAPYLDDGFRDLKRQTSPVLKAAAVLIGSLVGPAPQELVQQVAVSAMDFYTIEAGGSGVLRRLPELPDDFRYLAGLQGPGHRNLLFSPGVWTKPSTGSADGATGRAPPRKSEWETRPTCQSWMKILPPARWTASVTFFQPATCAAEYMPGVCM